MSTNIAVGISSCDIVARYLGKLEGRCNVPLMAMTEVHFIPAISHTKFLAVYAIALTKAVVGVLWNVGKNFLSRKCW
jgi:hypothetical protein